MCLQSIHSEDLVHLLNGTIMQNLGGVEKCYPLLLPECPLGLQSPNTILLRDDNGLSSDLYVASTVTEVSKDFVNSNSLIVEFHDFFILCTATFLQMFC